MPRVFITGANRGLGLEFVRQYAKDGWQIIACCRNPMQSDELNKIAKEYSNQIEAQALDVTDTQAISDLAMQLSDVQIDVLINNAGIKGAEPQDLDHMDFDSWQQVHKVNVMAPFAVSQAFHNNVARSEDGKIVIISSKMGSVGLNSASSMVIYRSSKSAVNMVMKCLANALQGKVTVAAFHPGWVRTDMGGPAGDIDAATSVSGLRAVIHKLTSTDNGGFFNYDGTRLDW